MKLLRHAASLALAALTATLLLAPPPAAGAGTRAAAEPVNSSVTAVSPAPGSVVAAGHVVLQARLHADQPVTTALFTVDDRPLPTEVGASDPVSGTEVRASVVLLEGEHTVRVHGEDHAGGLVERSWWVSATDRAVQRHAGPSRTATAVAASVAAFPAPASASGAVLARADGYTDALAGVPLAAAAKGPLLLSDRTALSPTTAAELQRVLVAGATVHLLGGAAALGEGVARAVTDLGFAVRRHAGPDRYATAAAVARQLPASTGAVVASGHAFPDALASSGPAAREGWPVLLTGPDDLPAPTADALAERDVTAATIVGGGGAVSVGVEQRLRQIVPTVTRIAGPDRYATAVAVADAFYPVASGLSLASGVDFPDALAGSRHAVELGQPLLLARPAGLPGATEAAVRARRPQRFDVYGGNAAVSEATASDALLAAIDGPHAPRVVALSPAAGQTVAVLDSVSVVFDRPLDPGSSSVYVAVAGVEVPGELEVGTATDTLTFRPNGRDVASIDSPWPAQVLVRAQAADGIVGRHAAAFTYLEPDPLYATAGDVALHLPSRGVEMIGFHEALHPGAQHQAARPTATPGVTLPTRGRGTGPRTAADVVADPSLPVLAPVTGRVLRAGSYVLNCRYADEYAVIEPDSRPGFEVKVLHFHGVRVRVGDRVVASETVIGDGPRQLPFTSQVDRISTTAWPHLHVEVVDTAIPPRPGGGC